MMARLELAGDGGYADAEPAVSLYTNGWARYNKAALETFAAHSRGTVDPEDYQSVAIYRHESESRFGVRFSTLDGDDAADRFENATWIRELGGSCGQLINARRILLDLLGVDESGFEERISISLEYDDQLHLLVGDYAPLHEHIDADDGGDDDD